VRPRDFYILATLAFGALTEALHGLVGGAPVDFVVLDTIGGLAFVAAGAVAWRRRPEVRTGSLLTLCGAIWFAGGYQLMPLPPAIPELGFALSGLYDLPLAYLLLTFPAESLVGLRGLGVGTLGLALLGRGLGRILLLPHPFTPFGSEAGFEAVESTTNWLVAGAALFVAIIAIARWSAARSLVRRLGWPVLAAGVLAMSLSALDAAETATGSLLLEFGAGPLATVVGWAPYVARALIPVGFLIGAIRLRRKRLPVAEVALRTGGTSTMTLQRALSSTTGDPDLVIVRWSGAAGAYLDSEGRPVTLPAPGDPARVATYIDDDGKPYAAVVHDALLAEERSILDSLRSAAHQALRGEDLRAAVGKVGETADLPQGDVTLLFSDIEGSTRHLQRLGLRYADALEQLRSIIREAVHEHGGQDVEVVGDEFFAAFGSPAAAARAAVAVQRRIKDRPWSDGVPIAVRIGLHRGNPTLTAGGYVGLDVHRAARIMSAANGGQILASEEVGGIAAAEASAQIRVRRLGPHRFRGLDEPIDVALLEASDAESSSAPIRAEPVE
jgi:class 3 adenylate cyclase